MKRVFLTAMVTLIFSPSFVFAETIVSDRYIENEKTWTLAESPYLVEGNGDIYVAETGTLSIESGVEIRMGNARKFDVYGNLNILGENGSEVFITNSTDDVFNISDRWGGFVFHPDSRGDISYLRIKNTGWVQYQPGGPAILNEGGEVNINNSRFANNIDAVRQKFGTTTIDHSSIDQNSNGIVFEGGDVSLTNSTISNSSGNSFMSYDYMPGTFFARNNVFSNNLHNPFLDLSIDFDIGSTTFENGDISTWTIGGNLYSSANIPSSNDPFNVSGIIINQGAELTVESGAILKGGYIINRGGVLNLNGTEEKPIIYTSKSDDSVGGDTNNDGGATSGDSFKIAGIETETLGTTNISHTFIKHAAGGSYIGPFNIAYSALFNNGGNVIVDNLHISETYHTGVHHNAGTTNITNSSVDGVGSSAVVYTSGDLKIENSSFENYAGSTLINTANTSIPDIRNNWWGTSTGPYHPIENTSGTAPIIQGNALFKPFLIAPPSETQTIDPVIIIPGIMGSAKKNGQLLIDPILHTYDDLIETLKANGYEEGKDLFAFPYEWRDSNILTANLLKNKINEVKGICGCSKVDLVAHSMGGLVAREYIQSGQYQNDVDQIIFLGTPHKGSPKAYLQWEAGEFPSGGITDTLIKLFFGVQALNNGFSSIFEYIQNRPIPSVQELLPTFDYLKDKDTGVLRNYPNNYPRNTFLEYLNNDISNLLNSGAKITNIIGNSGNNTIEKIRVVPSNETEIWQDGEPDGFDGQTTDRGLENGNGDGTVTVYGATLVSSLPNEEWSNTSHNSLPRETSARIFNILTNKTADEVIYLTPIEKILSIQLQSPIDVMITDPAGNKVGKNFATGGEYSEITNAFYSGFNNDDEEYITIPNPLDGEYKIEVQGTGNGGEYGVLTSYISEEFATTTETIGVTKLNQITELNVTVDNQNPENLATERKVNLEVLTNDINGAYDLGWIKDKKTIDGLIKQANLIIKFEKKRNGKYEEKVDKILIKLLKAELSLLLKREKITEEGYNLIKEDLEYLINNN